MKKQPVLNLLYQLASPVLLMALGLILIISPDAASALLSRILGWVFTLAGVGIGISAIFDRRGAVGKGLAAVLCVITGGWLTAHPLLLAASLGRFLGVLILLRGLRDLFLSRSRGHGQLLAVITVIAGLVLIVLPMTTSRLVFTLCGVVILIIGTAMLLDRLRDQRHLPSGKDDIIDAL